MAFTINVVPTVAFSHDQKAIIDAAAARLKKIVVGAPPDMSKLLIEIRPADLGPDRNARSKVITWWDKYRLPRYSELLLSETFLSSSPDKRRFGDIVLHELIHCLGFGLAWQKLDKIREINGEQLFVGEKAVQEYKKLLGAGKTSVPGVPLEEGEVAGQAHVHWRERVFGTELMTTAQPKAGNPLSRLSLASLEDLGYHVEYAYADHYQL